MICTLCPRNCRAEREDTQGGGVCGVGSMPKIARAALHMWEEPCISGTCGSGAVFFSGCGLRCIFCQNEAISQRVPDIPAYLQYSWGKGGDSHVRLSGILRNLSYRNLVSGKNHFVTGYGVQLSGLASLNKFVTLYYQGAYGKGIGRYVNDLGGFGYDLIYGDNGTMTAPETLSLVGGAQINLTDNLFVSGGYSLNRVYGQESLGGDAYRRANYVVANAFYTFAGDFQVGVEYLRGIRRDMNGESNTANRIEAMLKFSF